MQRYLKLLDWRANHENIALDLIRFFLGVALFVRGYYFITNQEVLSAFMENQGLLVGGMVVHYITLAHLYGGFIMAAGLLTRISAFVQIPVVLGAVYFHLTEGLLVQGQSLELSGLVLFLLFIILIYGPGKFSLDFFLFRDKAPVVLETETERAVREQGHLERAELIEAARARAEVEHPTQPSEAAVLTQPQRTAAADQPYESSQDTAERVKAAAKYAAVFVFAFVLFFSMILLDTVPIGFALDELAVIGGVVLLIFGLFFLFYKSAFQGSE